MRHSWQHGRIGEYAPLNTASNSSTTVAAAAGATAQRSIAELMRTAARHVAPPSLTYPEQFEATLRGVILESVLKQRAGLPRLASALEHSGRTREPLRICYLGGSVTEQRNGYRPRVTTWLKASGVAVEEVPAFCGNCGSKVLTFMVSDWVVSRRPHLVFIELVINDGDTLLETEDASSLGSALEGIVRHVRDALPTCELCMLYMFIRDDLPLELRTGSKAWADNTDTTAAATYHDRVPRLHDGVCERYGLPSISLIPVMAQLPPDLRAHVFRDDCHMLDPGAAFAAAAICAALEAMTTTQAAVSRAGALNGADSLSGEGRLPPPLHDRPWGRGRAQEVTPAELSFFYLKADQMPVDQEAYRHELLRRHARLDMDPLNNASQKPWWLLYVGESATLEFTGTRLGLLTMIGPDAGTIRCEVDGGRWQCTCTLLDRWAYFWRLAVVPLIEELPAGPHVAKLWLDPVVPDASVLKKRPSGPIWHEFKREGKEHKLWLMHWLMSSEWQTEPDTLSCLALPLDAPSSLDGSAFESRCGQRGRERPRARARPLPARREIASWGAKPAGRLWPGHGRKKSGQILIIMTKGTPRERNIPPPTISARVLLHCHTSVFLALALLRLRPGGWRL